MSEETTNQDPNPKDFEIENEEPKTLGETAALMPDSKRYIIAAFDEEMGTMMISCRGSEFEITHLLTKLITQVAIR